MITMPERARETSALAGCRCSLATTEGSMLAIAGNPTPDTMPWTRLSTISDQRSAAPVMTRAAMMPWLTAEAMLENCSTATRPNRSATTPPHRSSSTIGTVCAART